MESPALVSLWLWPSLQDKDITGPSGCVFLEPLCPSHPAGHILISKMSELPKPSSWPVQISSPSPPSEERRESQRGAVVCQGWTKPEHWVEGFRAIHNIGQGVMNKTSGLGRGLGKRLAMSMSLFSGMGLGGA